ncbi:hypothetical protein ACFL2R_04305, partial [Patescibacteria group bacterium]
MTGASEVMATGSNGVMLTGIGAMAFCLISVAAHLFVRLQEIKSLEEKLKWSEHVIKDAANALMEEFRENMHYIAYRLMQKMSKQEAELRSFNALLQGTVGQKDTVAYLESMASIVEELKDEANRYQNHQNSSIVGDIDFVYGVIQDLRDEHDSERIVGVITRNKKTIN